MSGRRIEVVVLEHLCKGCGLCVEVCEHGKLFINPRANQRGIQTAGVEPGVECTGCLKCATICPDAAIEITRFDEPAPARGGGSEHEAEG